MSIEKLFITKADSKFQHTCSVFYKHVAFTMFRYWLTPKFYRAICLHERRLELISRRSPLVQIICSKLAVLDNVGFRNFTSKCLGDDCVKEKTRQIKLELSMRQADTKLRHWFFILDYNFVDTFLASRFFSTEKKEVHITISGHVVRLRIYVKKNSEIQSLIRIVG